MPLTQVTVDRHWNWAISGVSAKASRAPRRASTLTPFSGGVGDVVIVVPRPPPGGPLFGLHPPAQPCSRLHGFLARREMLFTPYRRLAPRAWPEMNWYGFWRVVTTSSPALVTASR